MMKIFIKTLALFILVSLLSFKVGAVGLQDYLQENNTAKVSQTAEQLDSPEVLPDSTKSVGQSDATHIIELVVAGIVASALIISLLVMFLGRWAGNKERKAIKKLRIDAEKEKEHISSATATIREQEKETSKIVHDMRNQSTDFSTQRDLIKKHGEEVLESSKIIKATEQQVVSSSKDISEKINDTKINWDAQLSDTLSIIRELQSGLDQNLDKVGSDLNTISKQKDLSQELLKDFLTQHNNQTALINKNTDFSTSINKSLEETLAESQQLITTLKSHQESAEKSLKQFNQELTHYEEQAYEQFDTTFQVADLARQELTANIDESRKHIETMRRHEEQSHTLNTQTQKNLEALDFTKIVKISDTLDSTQDMFTDIHNKVSDAKSLLAELKDIETEIKSTANNVENATYQKADDALLTDYIEIDLGKVTEEQTSTADAEKSLIEDAYKMASGDNTPISFFSTIKKKKKD